MDDLLRALAERDDGLLEWSRMRAAGATERQILLAVRDLRALHDGVWVTGHGPVTRRQRRRGATLSTPRSVLSHRSGAALWEFRPWDGGFEIVTRPGSGGPRWFGNLLVHRSRTLDGDCVERDGLLVTTPARTLVDLSPALTATQRAKAVREAIRLTPMTALDLRLAAARHRHRPGTQLLDALGAELEGLPIKRTKSDAEARAVQILASVGALAPDVNQIVAGEEADLSWPALRLIVEIDGPQFHRFAGDDARKAAIWRAAGFVVLRISSDDVFDHPARLLDLARPALVTPAAPPPHAGARPSTPLQA